MQKNWQSTPKEHTKGDSKKLLPSECHSQCSESLEYSGRAFAQKLGGGVGRFLPLLAGAGLILNVDQAEGSMRDYINSVNSGDMLGATTAAADISSDAGLLQSRLFMDLLNAAEEAGCR